MSRVVVRAFESPISTSSGLDVLKAIRSRCDRSTRRPRHEEGPHGAGIVRSEKVRVMMGGAMGASSSFDRGMTFCRAFETCSARADERSWFYGPTAKSSTGPTEPSRGRRKMCTINSASTTVAQEGGRIVQPRSSRGRPPTPWRRRSRGPEKRPGRSRRCKCRLLPVLPRPSPWRASGNPGELGRKHRRTIGGDDSLRPASLASRARSFASPFPSPRAQAATGRP